MYIYKKIPLTVQAPLPFKSIQALTSTVSISIYTFCCLYINITPKIGKSQGKGKKITGLYKFFGSPTQFFQIADIIFSFESLEITK